MEYNDDFFCSLSKNIFSNNFKNNRIKLHILNIYLEQGKNNNTRFTFQIFNFPLIITNSISFSINFKYF